MPSSGVELAFRLAHKPVPTLAYTCRNGIPFGSGLGSSSAAIVSGLLAGLVLAGKELQVQADSDQHQAWVGTIRQLHEEWGDMLI